ncbi:MAG: hypothetical protein R3C55_12370 [Parvularculaceae bacterium]
MRGTLNRARAERRPGAFRAFLSPIKKATDAILNISTGGSSVMSLDTRLGPGEDDEA